SGGGGGGGLGVDAGAAGTDLDRSHQPGYALLGPTPLQLCGASRRTRHPTKRLTRTSYADVGTFQFPHALCEIVDVLMQVSRTGWASMPPVVSLAHTMRSPRCPSDGMGGMSAG